MRCVVEVVSVLLVDFDELELLFPLLELKARAMALLKFQTVVTPHIVEKVSDANGSRLPKYCRTPALLMKVCQPSP